MRIMWQTYLKAWVLVDSGGNYVYVLNTAEQKEYGFNAPNLK